MTRRVDFRDVGGPVLEERVFMHDHISGQPCDICAFRSRFWTLKDSAERMKDVLEEIVDLPHSDTCDSVLCTDSLSGEPIYPCTCFVLLARAGLKP